MDRNTFNKTNKSLTKQIKESIILIHWYENTIASRYDKLRYELMIALVNREIDKLNGLIDDKLDCGLTGRVIELITRSSGSKMIEVQPQDKLDVRLHNNGSGYIWCEVKTGGGRIGSLLDMPIDKAMKTGFIYFMNYRTKTKNSQLRQLFKICTVADVLNHFANNPKAIKPIKGAKNCKNSTDGIGIQLSNNAWYEFMSAQRDFTRNTDFNL